MATAEAENDVALWTSDVLLLRISSYRDMLEPSSLSPKKHVAHRREQPISSTSGNSSTDCTTIRHPARLLHRRHCPRDAGHPVTINAMAVNLPKLDYDILHEVMTFCDKRTLSRMAQTCSTLRYQGSRLLLKGTVKVQDESALESLCCFLRADNFSRTRYLRDLELSLDEKPPRRITRQLGEVLSRSTRLESLTLAEVELILESRDPSLANTLAALTSLRGLALSGAEELTRSMLTQLQSPLEELRIEYSSALEEALTPAELLAYHPLAVCQAFAGSLEDLDCRFSSPHAAEAGFAYPPLPTYPTLRCLRLQDDWPVLRPWIVSCPNLAVLSTETYWEEGLDDDAEVEWDGLRLRNLDDQRAHGSWARLEEYTGSVLALYILGLTCRIPSLTIEGEVKHRHVEMLRAALAEAKPGYLRMSMVGPLEDFGDDERGLVALLDPAGTSELKTLDLSLWIEPVWAGEGHDTFDFQVLTGYTLEALARLPSLQHLDLDIRRPQAPPRRTRGRAGCSPDPDRDIDLASFGRQAVEITPTLAKAEILLWYPDHRRARRFVEVTKEGDEIAVLEK